MNTKALCDPQGFFVVSAAICPYTKDDMVTTKKQALGIATKVRRELETLYGERLRGVVLFGSAARGKLDEDSDIDIAIILDQITDRFSEHEQAGDIGSQISLEYDTLVSFLFVSEADYQKGRFAIHRRIKEEGISA